MSRNTPLIGVIPLIDEERDSYWMLPGYFDGIQAAGGIPVMLPPTGDPQTLLPLSQRLDGLLVTGGQDIDPALYGQEKEPVCDLLCPVRDQMESFLAARLLEEDKPVLGICRGLQFLCAFLGGSLWQDLSSQFGTQVAHRQPKPYTQPAHPVQILPHTPLHRILGVDRWEVNSCHHQGVRQLSPRLQPMALAPDGLVEALWAPEYRFCMAVQWHPEMLEAGNPLSRKLFGAFLDACR